MRSNRKDNTGSLKLALFHRGAAAYRSMDIYLQEEQWDAKSAQVVKRPDKKFLNVELRKTFADACVALASLSQRKDFDSFTAKELLGMVFRRGGTVDEPADLDYVVPVYNEYITLCRKTSTAQTYKSSLRNLIEYCDDIDTLRFKDITGAWLKKYQNWLVADKGKSDDGGNGMSVNGANLYLRNLRTIFNYAINNQFTKAPYPFKQIDMSTAEPDRREIPYEKFLEWATKPMLDNRIFYRDLFMLSFYLCGIRPIDLLYAKKSQVEDGRLVYKPEKLNGRTKLSVKIEPEAWEIIKKYEGKEYLINVMESRKDYKQFCKQWNKAVRAIGDDLFGVKRGRNGTEYVTVKHKGVVPYITVYYARSCFASYLYNEIDVPMDVISQALGHKSGLKVTNLYVKRDVTKVDKANRQLIDKVTSDMARYAERYASA